MLLVLGKLGLGIPQKSKLLVESYLRFETCSSTAKHTAHRGVIDNTKLTLHCVVMVAFEGLGMLFWTAYCSGLSHCSDCYFGNNGTCSLWVSGKMPRLLKVAASEF